MQTFLQIVMFLFILGAAVAYLRFRSKREYIEEIIKKWRMNPTKMDLSLATTKQIVRELQTRPQPIILVMPEMPKVGGEPVKSIQVYVLGIHPAHARMILHGAGELLNQSGSLPGVPPDENEDSTDP